MMQNSIKSINHWLKNPDLRCDLFKMSMTIGVINQKGKMECSKMDKQLGAILLRVKRFLLNQNLNIGIPVRFLSIGPTSYQQSSTRPTNKNKVKTAILMLNMGGPKNLDDVEPFLTNLFLDNDIIKLPMQSWLGPFIAKKRTPKVAKKYAQIGGGSPLHHWTNKQGTELIEKLNQISPQTAPHQYYIGFRYTEPSLENALEQIERDQATRVIAFSQYPQYCCNTSGSSMNQIARYFLNKKPNSPLPSSYRLSFIDRWPLNSGLIRTFSDLIRQEIAKFPKQDDVLLLFTAHSLPLSSVNVGDPYTMEVSSTVMQVMNELKFSFPFRLVWQSKVGPVAWQAPATPDAIKGFIEKGYKNILLVPISFVNEHIETLHELDIEYCQELVEKMPIETIRRCPAPNDHPEFIDGIVSLIQEHLKSQVDVPPQLLAQCPLCQKQVCSDTRRWLRQLKDAQRTKAG